MASFTFGIWGEAPDAYDINGLRAAEKSRRAEERSLYLLLANLSPQQRKDWKKHRSFEVRTKAGCFRIFSDGGIRRPDGTWQCQLMYEWHVAGLPVYDRVLALKLQFEQAPETFFGGFLHWHREVRAYRAQLSMAILVGAMIVGGGAAIGGLGWWLWRNFSGDRLIQKAKRRRCSCEI